METIRATGSSWLVHVYFGPNSRMSSVVLTLLQSSAGVLGHSCVSTLLTFFRNVLVNNLVFRYMGQSGQPLMSLRPWRSPVVEPKENRVEDSLSDPTMSPDEPKSEPLPEIPSLLPAENGLKKSKLYRQQSLVILTGRTNTSWSRSGPVLTPHVSLQNRNTTKTCQSPR